MFAIGDRKSTIASPLGVLAQLVERLNGIEEVTGSNPVGSKAASVERKSNAWGSLSDALAGA
jgi:ethanolamine transporter EutH